MCMRPYRIGMYMKLVKIHFISQQQLSFVLFIHDIAPPLSSPSMIRAGVSLSSQVPARAHTRGNISCVISSDDVALRLQ